MLPGLLVPVGDAALGQIVGREFQGDAVAIHDLDAVAAEPACHGGEDGLAGVEFDREHTSFEFLDNFSEDFD